MGSPRKIRKKYSPPSHPWQRERINQEKTLNKTYSFKNKKEIWKMVSTLKDFTSQAKTLNARIGPQAELEAEQLVARLQRLGLVKENATLDTVLDLQVENILERRLQSIVYRKGLAHTMKQARQFIVHGHIAVKGIPITRPSHLVTIDEEQGITFLMTSALADPEHPERSLKPQQPAAPVESPKAEATPEATA